MELHQMSALDIGNLVKKKAVKPREVINHFADRIAKIDPVINAFTYTKIDEALEEADKLEQVIMRGEPVGPLAGVPVALKDFLPSKKGWQNSHGGVPALVQKDTEDSVFCQAVESVDAIVIGKTNAPAFGFRGLTDNVMYGPTSTPFKPGYNSGGSSGGSCAAVAAGLVSVAELGDAGGSARCPAAWSGCLGYKPSAGVVPSVCRPDAWTATHPYCCGGPGTRSVADLELVFRRMVGYDPKDPINIPTPHGFMDRAKETIKGMKIGFTFDFGLFPEPDAEIKTAMLSTMVQLGRFGADIDMIKKFNWKHTKADFEDAWLRGICVDTAIDMELWKKQGFDLNDYKEQLPENFFYWNRVALNSSMMNYREFHEIRTDILDAHLEVFDKFDVILAPVTGCMPVKNSEDRSSLTIGPTSISGVEVDPLIGFCYTYLENMIGTPAASVPIGLSKDGFPIGLQVIAPRYKDADVFRIAYAIEQLQPWAWMYDKLQF